MKISVIMPVHNGLRFLKESIDSVLTQTVQDFEFVIVDDASTEPVWDILCQYQQNDERFVIFRNQTKMGIANSLNSALAHATGDYIARQDADDISLSPRFEEELKLFSDNIGLVSCWGVGIDENGKVLPDDSLKKIQVDDSIVKRRLLYKGWNQIIHPSVIFTRKVFATIGYYDNSVSVFEDMNYWLRIFKFFDFKVCHKELMQYRRHNNQFTAHNAGLTKEQRAAYRMRTYSRADTHTVIKNLE